MGSDITCVPISFFDHPSIRGAAVVEYVSKGSGVLKDGGGGRCKEVVVIQRDAAVLGGERE